MQKTAYIKLSGILALIAGTLVIGFAVFLPRLLDINAYRDEIISTLQQSLNRKVSFSNGTFAWHFGPSFDFTGVTVKEPDGSSDFLKAERITVRLALLPLLKKAGRSAGCARRRCRNPPCPGQRRQAEH